jgi:hypothetical protein
MQSGNEVAGENLPDVRHFPVRVVKAFNQSVYGFNHVTQSGAGRKGVWCLVAALLYIQYQKCFTRIRIVGNPFAPGREKHTPENVQTKQSSKSGKYREYYQADG